MKQTPNMIYWMIAVFTLVLIGSGISIAQPEIKYIGSSTVGIYMNAAAKVYPDASFSLNTNPESSGGEMAIAKGTYDLGGVAREVRSMILSKRVKEFYIGKDAIGVWVHKDNPVTELTKDQLTKIYTGKISNWKKLGGPNKRISVYITSNRSATYKVFKKIILDGEPYHKTAIQSPTTDSVVLDNIHKNKWGIGQLSLAIAAEHQYAESAKTISVDGQKASANNPDYPIGRPLYLITKGDPKGPVKTFIDWTLSEPGQEIVKKYFIGK